MSRADNAYDNALVWMRNDDTGEMLCLTKGGYTNRLSDFIGKHNWLWTTLPG